MTLPCPTTTLAELDGWWIELRCGCRVVYMPCKLLARDRGGHHQAGEIARRFRCRDCGGRAVAPALTADPQALYAGSGGATGLRIPLA
jgi:hypothetical protein